MPIKIEYLDNGIGFIFIGEGVITGDDIINSNKIIFSSKERMRKYKYGLIDYSNITQFNVSNPEIEIIASQDKKASKYIPDGVLAVTAKKDLEFGLTRMWEMIVENSGVQWETMVFRLRQDAEAWIKEKVRINYGIDDLTFG